MTLRQSADQGKTGSVSPSQRLALWYAVRSDAGRVREGKEDSAYAGPHLLAVADGMGGHAAGEVAAAITTIAPLDAEHPSLDLVDALAVADRCLLCTDALPR